MKKQLTLILLMSTTLLTGASYAMTAKQLENAIEAGEKLTVIDVRHRAHFARGHIPGAINIPVSLLDRKQLPPLGKVIVCGDGIQVHETLKAVEALNNKPGINAEVLDGGMKAWESLSLPDTQAAGMRDEVQQYVSYDELGKIIGADSQTTVVDLRTDRKGDKDSAQVLISDIKEQFPQVNILDQRNSKLKMRKTLAAIIAQHEAKDSQLFILIDDGDQYAEKVARRLWAAGVQRVAILAGGEQILSRRGHAGNRKVIRGGNGEQQ